MGFKYIFTVHKDTKIYKKITTNCENTIFRNFILTNNAINKKVTRHVEITLNEFIELLSNNVNTLIADDFNGIQINKEYILYSDNKKESSIKITIFYKERIYIIRVEYSEKNNTQKKIVVTIENKSFDYSDDAVNELTNLMSKLN